jgi:hypothetical protein
MDFSIIFFEIFKLILGLVFQEIINGTGQMVKFRFLIRLFLMINIYIKKHPRFIENQAIFEFSLKIDRKYSRIHQK